VQNLGQAGCNLWVVTNKPGHASRAILAELGLADRFVEIVSRDSRTPAFANKAEVLINLLKACGLDRWTTIMVGDTLEDCHAAERAGIECVLVPHGYGRIEGSLPRGCRAIAGWGELIEWCQLSDAVAVSTARAVHELKTGEYR
jgi:phosphoglycolate phosphatase-like HAD superfamily hydrolase